MNHHVIKTGIIGGSMNNQWASRAHIPALTEHPDFQITAIGTSNMESAKKSAAAVGAPLAFADIQALAESKDVDLVVVSVKVPFHYEASIAAIEAHKHVYCEWPLAIDTKQAKKLAELAEKAGIHHAVGLQARQSPEINYLKQAVQKGEIGKVLSCTMHVATQGKGGITDEKSSYLLYQENGADLLAINGGHSLDALCYILGGFKELSDLTNINYPEAIVQESGERIHKNTADQILINGTLTSGASASVHIQGGVYPAFRLDIQGEKGAFRLSQQRSAGHVQFGRLTLEKLSYSDSSALFTDAEEIRWESVRQSSEKDAHPAGYVKKAFHVLAGDIVENKRDIPDFHDAVKLHMLLDAVRESAETGRKIVIAQ
ncbi:Gfo/Idh/MocA family protein [Bacillus sonorensis]|uniref:Gfo/Idh/MocA family protein n=1 Tax=Bacillus sonorensis TaxID=119858 RepID=UPI0022E98128|nr:Gfo/Idh/MocA family oxidoreductase [Bacillus sonorensis]